MPDDMHGKIVLEAIACATQLDGSFVLDMNGKIAMHDVYIFGVNPKWTRDL